MKKIKISAIMLSLFTVLSSGLLFINIIGGINKKSIINIDGTDYFVATKSGSYLDLIILTSVFLIITIVLWGIYIINKNKQRR